MRGWMMWVATAVVTLGCATGFALTGTGDSGTNALETVSPMLNSVSAVTEKSLSATFSEPMRAPGVTTPGNYAASGAGVGTLGLNPTGVSGSGPYTLTWTAGEMQNGSAVTVTATGVQDTVGNLISPAHSSASGTGIGVAPVFGSVLASPAQASTGEPVTITFTASEALNTDPIVTVNGHDAVFVSGGASYTYSYTVQAGDPLGMASLSITGLDLAANMGSLSSDAALEIIEAHAGLPLRAWPVIAALTLAGVAMFARRRRLRKSPFEAFAK